MLFATRDETLEGAPGSLCAAPHARRARCQRLQVADRVARTFFNKWILGARLFACQRSCGSGRWCQVPDWEESGKYILSQALDIKSPMLLDRSKEGSLFRGIMPKARAR